MLALAAVAVVLVSQRHRTARPDPVAEYVTSLNSVTQRLRYRLTRAEAAYRTFAASGRIEDTTRPRLVAALRTLRDYRGQVRALTAPAEALRLRGAVLRYIGAQLSVAREAEELAAFMPTFVVRLNELRASGASLARNARSGSAGVRVRQASALDAWVAQTRPTLSRLLDLEPPDVMRPTYEAQVAALTASRAAAARLAAALRERPSSEDASLSRRFAVATRSALTQARQHAEIAAVKAYNRRVSQVSRLRVRADAELKRLQRSRG